MSITEHFAPDDTFGVKAVRATLIRFYSTSAIMARFDRFAFASHVYTQKLIKVANQKQDKPRCKQSLDCVCWEPLLRLSHRTSKQTINHSAMIGNLVRAALSISLSPEMGYVN